MRAFFAFIVCVSVSCAAAAEDSPPPEPAPPPPPTYPGVPAADDADEVAPSPDVPADTPPRYGLSLGLEGSRSLGKPVTAAGLGFSASALFAFDAPLGLVQLGMTIWPDGLRANRIEQSESHQRRNYEFFVAASLYPFNLDALHFGFYLLLTLTNIADSEAERGTLGASVLWSISERFGLRYQLGFSTETNLVNVGMASTLSADVVLF